MCLPEVLQYTKTKQDDEASRMVYTRALYRDMGLTVVRVRSLLEEV